jgi:hypothetical protein
MHAAARRSLSSILLTAAAITVNHLYVLGFRALLLGAALAIVPIALLLWFRATRSAVAFGAYLLMNLWIVVGFGLLKGLWGIMLPLYAGTLLASHSSSYPSPTLGDSSKRGAPMCGAPPSRPRRVMPPRSESP